MINHKIEFHFSDWVTFDTPQHDFFINFLRYLYEHK